MTTKSEAINQPKRAISDYSRVASASWFANVNNNGNANNNNASNSIGVRPDFTSVYTIKDSESEYGKAKGEIVLPIW